MNDDHVMDLTLIVLTSNFNWKSSQIEKEIVLTTIYINDYNDLSAWQERIFQRRKKTNSKIFSISYFFNSSVKGVKPWVNILQNSSMCQPIWVHICGV